MPLSSSWGSAVEWRKLVTVVLALTQAMPQGSLTLLTTFT